MTRPSHPSRKFGYFMQFSAGNYGCPFSFQLKDPGKLLEGGGKYRRHVKLQTVEEINSKQVRQFLEQAFALD